MSVRDDETMSGLLYVLSTPKPEHLDEYNGWYNTEHGPLRMKLPFISNGYRYSSIEPDSSVFLAIYDVSDPGGLQSEEYLRLREHRSQRETVMLNEKLDSLDRRVYTIISSIGNSVDPTPLIMAVTFVVKNELEDEVHQWYEQEHTSDLSNIPGWRRTRRFKLIESDDSQEGFTELLAIHDFDEQNGLDGPEHELAKSQPWRTKVVAMVESRDNRRFELFHEFRAEDYRPPPTT